jgi:hypothetical protein
VGSYVPEKEVDRWWLTQRWLIQHAVRCSQFASHNMVTDDDMHQAYYTLVDLFSDQGKLDEVEKMYSHALEGYEKRFGFNISSIHIFLP